MDYSQQQRQQRENQDRPQRRQQRQQRGHQDRPQQQQRSQSRDHDRTLQQQHIQQQRLLRQLRRKQHQRRRRQPHQQQPRRQQHVQQQSRQLSPSQVISASPARNYVGFPPLRSSAEGHRPHGTHDIIGVQLGPRYDSLCRVFVPGQSIDDRFSMVAHLRNIGFLDDEEYPTLKDFIASLPHLHQRADLLLVMDVRVYNFLIEGFMREGNFDFRLVSSIYDRVVDKLSSNAWSIRPHLQTKHGRDLMSTIEEY